MKALLRMLCALVRHRPPEGSSRARAIYYQCSRCGSLVVGDMGQRR